MRTTLSTQVQQILPGYSFLAEWYGVSLSDDDPAIGDVTGFSPDRVTPVPGSVPDPTCSKAGFFVFRDVVGFAGNGFFRNFEAVALATVFVPALASVMALIGLGPVEAVKLDLFDVELTFGLQKLRSEMKARAPSWPF